MRRHDPLVHLLLAIFHPPRASCLMLPTPPFIEVRNPTFPEPTAPPSQQLASNPSCSLLSQALSICAVLTPGFVTLLPPQQAHCLCYSSTVWAPNVFDDAVKTCADFASTAASGAFPPLLNLEGFCLSVGDVDKDAPASVQATPTGRIPGAGMGGTHGNTNEVTPGSNYVPPMPTYGTGNGSGANGEQGGSGNGADGSDGSSNNGGGGVDGNGGSGSGSGGQGATSSPTGSPAPTPTISSGSNGLGTLTPTTSISGVTITVVGGGVGATKTADGSVRNRGEVTDMEVVLVSLAISALILFL
ncbi:hypothetical protein ONS95_000192 [Cadophora gregata]|uniref:uncharacterized protein n=1 Tax=Cadophora gregata TaxID=51156 RepID=UPI0026DCBA57|nr:uncharacterized protein ONS95_000192 [Cadophora gregata]KAK0115529.1 hypothetical protein ONS96_013983 [Cadophora gregata f. sp. sojae]KAK0128215.1 hypothetical protein ONS95_000192 [Cadophora gregata]